MARIVLRRAAPQNRTGRLPSRRVFAFAAAATSGALALTFLVTGGSGTPTARSSDTAARPSPSTEILAEDKGRIETLRKARIQALSAVEVQPLFDAGARATLDQASMVHFTVPGHSAGKDAAGVMTAVLLHGSDEPVPLAVVDKGDGQVEVPFTPHGFGRFDVQLRANGIPIAQSRVGVVGSAAGAQYADDYLDYTADMRSGRNRPKARGGRSR